MIRAGTTSEVTLSSGDWLILDIGFANKAKSCGLMINDGYPQEMQFSEAIYQIQDYINKCDSQVNLIVEAPLSVAFDVNGNPKGRSVEKQGAKTRYWYVGLGCTVMVAAMYLVKALSNCKSETEICLFEGFVSFKESDGKSNHSNDVRLLREVVEMPHAFTASIIPPSQLKVDESDMLQSAFLVAGVDAGVPPVIMRNGQ